jgi:hypothetical protein
MSIIQKYLSLVSDRDFDNMTINVMRKDTIPSEHVFFKQRPVFSGKMKVDKNILIRYITLMYDPKSPLINKINEHIERKKASAVIAGWRPKNDNTWAPEVEDILYCRDPKVNDCIIEYLRGLQNDLWSALCAAREALYVVLHDLMENKDHTRLDVKGKTYKGTSKTPVEIAKVRADLDEKAELMAERLNRRVLSFLRNDESPYLRKHLFDLMDKERMKLKITPERIAFGED